MNIINLIAAILAGLSISIPLVVNLIKYVQTAVKEKNWSKLLELVMEFMERAETMLATGAERKEWVLAMVKASADSINYDVDISAISALIDSLCDLTKAVNAEAVTCEE